jgi:hypothetical protein
MNTIVHYDEHAPKRERYRVLRAADGGDATDGRIATVESFGTERVAHAFAQGFTLGTAYAPAPEPLDANEALRLVKLARDDYKRECRSLRAQLAEFRESAV